MERDQNVDIASRPVEVLQALAMARKATRLYPRANPQVELTIRRLERALNGQTAPVVVTIERDRFDLGEDRPLSSVAEALDRMAFKLHCLNVRELRLEPGFEEAEIEAFLALLNQPFDRLHNLGPFDETLISHGVSHARVRFEEGVRTKKEGEGDSRKVRPPTLGHPDHLLRLLTDPGQYARELVRHCVDVVPESGQSRFDAQLAFVDRSLQATGSAIESAPAETRADHYDQLVAAVDAIIRSADVSGARMGGLPTVDLSHIDHRVLEVLPQRDLVKEISSKVKLHQGATTVMTSALRELPLDATSPNTAPAVLAVIEERREAAGSVASNIQVLEDIRVGEDVDGEYPGIKFAERDRNKNFSLGVEALAARLDSTERGETKKMVDDLVDWRPEVDAIETILDMLANEAGTNFFQMIAERLVEKVGEFLKIGDLEPALHIVRGLNVERRQRRDDPFKLMHLEAALSALEQREHVAALMDRAEALEVESPAFKMTQSFLFLLDRRVIQTIVSIVSSDRSRYSQQRVLAMAQTLCRSHVEVLAEGLAASDPQVVKTVTWLLGHFGEGALRHLDTATEHPDARVRREAIRALARIGGAGIASITEMVRDNDHGVVGAALHALMASDATDVDSALEAALLQDEWSARPRELNLLLVRAAGKLGGEPILRALRRVEGDHGLRFKLKTTALREALRTARRDVAKRIGTAEATGPRVRHA